jgi:hypothetical protein
MHRKSEDGIYVVESRVPGSKSTQGSREDSRKESFPYISGRGNAKHILLKCSERRTWRVEFLYRKWLCINEDIACNNVMKCTNVTDLRNRDIYLKLDVVR